MNVVERVLVQKPDPELWCRAAEIDLERGANEDATLVLPNLEICFHAAQRDLAKLMLLAPTFEMTGLAVEFAEPRDEVARVAADKGDLATAKHVAWALLREANQDQAVHELARSIPAVDRASKRRTDSAPPASAPPIRTKTLSLKCRRMSWRCPHRSRCDLVSSQVSAPHGLPRHHTLSIIAWNLASTTKTRTESGR